MVLTPRGLMAALTTPGRYAVKSDKGLAASVRQKLLNRGIDATLHPVAELEKLRYRDGVKPVELLLGLGRTTSALPGLHAAGAAGLAGLAALRTASRWAIIRYLWAFHEDRPELYLSALTEQVRFHQRTLLSEQFGIALATDLVEHRILKHSARVVDADAVSYDPVLGPLMSRLRGHKPDYFWYDTRGGRLNEVLVVEVKGNSSNRDQTLKQLARGVEQVLVPTSIPGVRMRRIVIGTCLAGDALEAFAVEVEDPSAATRQDAMVQLARRERVDLEDYGAPREMTEYFEDEVNPEEALRDMETLDQVRLLAFAGIPAMSVDIRENPERIRSAVEFLEAVDADDTTFRCETTRIVLDGQRVQVRTGVAEQVLDVTTHQGIENERDRYAARYQDGIYSAMFGRSRSRPDEELEIIASADGCMLSISVE